MLTIFLLFILLIILIFAYRSTKSKAVGIALIGVLNLFILEFFIYIYFLILIMRGDCFLLIGNQKGLDTFIKARVTYSTYFAQGKKDFLYRIDNQLGYTLGKDKDTGLYQTNKEGFRALREYEFAPSPNKLRVAAFGDSFVFGEYEKNVDVWSHYLEKTVGNLDVLNFGITGYGFGQSYLRFLKDGLKYSPDIVTFNYIQMGSRDRLLPHNFVVTGNIRKADMYRVNFDLKDNILNYKSVEPYDLFDPTFRREKFIEPMGLEKPGSLLASKIFSKTNTGLLIKTLIERDYILKRYRKPDYSDEAVTLFVLKDLLQRAERDHFYVIFFYWQDYAEISPNIRALFENYPDRVIYVNSTKLLNQIFAENGYTEKQLLNVSEHYNAKGNEFYGEAILRILKSRVWGEGERKFKYDEATHSFKRL